SLESPPGKANRGPSTEAPTDVEVFLACSTKSGKRMLASVVGSFAVPLPKTLSAVARLVFVQIAAPAATAAGLTRLICRSFVRSSPYEPDTDRRQAPPN